MDAFFASVEQKRRPKLLGKPVVIGGDGDPTKRGVVSTASYEARKFGIHSAMPLRTAHKLCPYAVFLPVDYEEYSRVSERVMKVLGEFTSTIEHAGIDEAFLDISQISKPSDEIAKEIKKRIKQETGLTCSIGIAPNKLLAKISSDMQKPDGLTIITKEDIERRIWPLPVRKLRGVGPKNSAYLQSMGINTIGELTSVPLDKLIERFGKSYGQYLYAASRGIDESPIITHWEPKSAGREITFQKDIDNRQILRKILAEVTSEVVSDIRQRGYKGKTVTLKVRFSDFETHALAKTLYEHTDSLKEIRRAAFDCFNRLKFKKKVRLIGIRVSRLEKVIHFEAG
ncbi:MAG: DNA polymerase IV [Desulfobacterales bacterium]|nr:DNA polymerase IV [Desulfobacterales bacterium]